MLILLNHYRCCCHFLPQYGSKALAVFVQIYRHFVQHTNDNDPKNKATFKTRLKATTFSKLIMKQLTKKILLCNNVLICCLEFGWKVEDALIKCKTMWNSTILLLTCTEIMKYMMYLRWNLTLIFESNPFDLHLYNVLQIVTWFSSQDHFQGKHLTIQA